MNNQKIAEHYTGRPGELTRGSWTYTLYGDGSVGVAYWSDCQGSRSGRRWRTSPGYIDRWQGEEDTPESRLEAYVAWVQQEQSTGGWDVWDVEQDSDFRPTSPGYVVQ